MFKISKKINEQRITVNNKDTGMTFGSSIVNFEHILPFIPQLMLLNLNK